MLHGFERKTRCREQCHGVNAVKRIDCAVGMARRKRAVMAGIECLQHIERFGPTNLSDNETIGIQEFNRLIYSSPDFYPVLLPLRDGVTVAMKI